MEKINIFLKKLKLEFLSILFGYSLLVGFIYSYFQFNFELKFNIFDYMNSTDILFSWLTDVYLLSFMIILISALILKSYSNKIIFISLILTNTILISCLLIESLKLENVKNLVFLLLLIITLFFSYLFILNYKFRLTNENKNIDKFIIRLKSYSIFQQFKCLNIDDFTTIKKYDDTPELKRKYLNLLDEINTVYSASDIKINHLKEKMTPSIPTHLSRAKNHSFSMYFIINELITNDIKNKLYLLQKLYKLDEFYSDKIEKLIELSNFNFNMINDLKRNNPINDFFISFFIFLLVPILFGQITAKSLKDINNSTNIVDIKLVRNLEPNNKQDYYKLYKVTSNYTILKKCGDSDFTVFNNNDISFIKFDTEYNFKECQEKIKSNETKKRNEENLILIKLENIINLLNMNNFKFNKIIYNNNLYFEDLIFKTDMNSFEDLNNIIDLVNDKNKYVINIIGKSSKKNININNNIIKDNYSLSTARAENTKRAIINKLIENNKNIKNIEFNTVGESNQTAEKNSKGSIEIQVLEFIATI